MKRLLPILLLLLSLAAGSCRRERFFEGSTSLRFSQDTVWFDTVFTQQPGGKYPISVTQMAWVKNTERFTVRASFRLGGGKNSAYRINVDGLAGPEIPVVEIPGRDSVFVFIQCSLEANGQTGPALVLDSLMTVVNGREQKMFLGAYGWDAHYFRSTALPCGGVWDDQTKPYVCIDDVLVPEGCLFTIKEGVTVYNSARSRFLVAGRLNVEGRPEKRVLFTGDKPVFNARFLPNQWVGMQMLVGSSGNSIRYADIQNAAIGIRVDSLPVGNPWNLTLEGCRVLYCGQACLAGITAKINATNCLFAQAGSYSFLGLLGGAYDFRHCTFANTVNYGNRQDGHFAITNTLRDENGRILSTADLSCNTYNSVIWGNLTEELTVDRGGSAPFSTVFEGNFIRSREKPFPTADNTYNVNPLFIDPAAGDFRPDTLSPLHEAGRVLSPPVTLDLNGKPRINKPDVGAFERPD